jgi:hypothetical protein
MWFLCLFFCEGKAVPELLTEHHAMKAYWKWRSHSFTSALDGGPLYPQGKSPVTHWIGGWVGLRVCLDAVVKRKIPSPGRTQTFNHPACSPMLYH